MPTPTAFHKILEKYRTYAFSERDKGEKFERLIQTYLQTDPRYASLFSNVWMWDQFPGRKDFGGKDTGIDLVGLTHEGDYWAVQCKCFQENSSIGKKEVDSFLSTSSRTFVNHNFQTVGFEHRLWVSTTNKWGVNAEEAIRNQNPPVSRINLYDLEEAEVDWEALDKGISGDLARTKKHELKTHQRKALDNTISYFQEADRGKLIMACGTGKTFTSLRIAEKVSGGSGLVLFLVPSISLLGQTLREWTAHAIDPLKPISVCSDPRISKTFNKQADSDSFSVVDLALPASTDPEKISQQLNTHLSSNEPGMTVVFSTYQSIKVVAEAQKTYLAANPESKDRGIFDLIICDEAHRTTGVTIAGEDESTFVKVHDNDFLQARKRIYMTATPRLYSDDSKARAAQEDAILASMDDTSLYGEEMYRIGFGKAVNLGLLTDYKVLILTMSESDVPTVVQRAISNRESEISADDTTKLIGCINALSKQILGDKGFVKESDPEPMKRAVAFCQNIKVSKKITTTFNTASEVYLDAIPDESKDRMVSVGSRHIDGSMAAPERDELLGWLKSTASDTNECRVLTNVRCLSEGVDVPSLDAVMFLSARNSQVDVVQSVGRVMRKSPGKNYGYIIIPVVIPADVEPDKALDDNDRFKVVWTVLNALRAHDDRFNATVNKIELNKRKPSQILVGGSPDWFGEGKPSIGEEEQAPYGAASDKIGRQIAMKFEQLQGMMYARMVEKVGDRRYWEQWAQSVGEIAERQGERINRLIKEDGDHQTAFEEFLNGLRKNINPSISQSEAVEMLSQHIITRPVFEALFEGYSFVQSNPISVSMQKMLDLLEAQSVEKDTETLDKFYESVRMRAAGIDNAEGKQRIIIELYDKFFKTAFPGMVEKLGIVYTPVEVVDFIIHSVDDVLQKEFGRRISDENVHIMDPFTGTGTFVTRLLQSGLIDTKDLARKYATELHANEIVLLAYYIAAVNIENAYHDALAFGLDSKDIAYQSFEGICLTDTFQLGETGAEEALFSEMFPQNSERVEAQKKAPIQVIMGNPPYSVGQRSANDNAQNQEYPKLDQRIANTYAARTDSTNKNSLYNSYIKAFRWSTDRLDKTNGGMVAFVTDGGWIDNNSHDGFRKYLEEEFSSIYVFNLRGNARTQGALRQKEAGNVFGSGSRTPISITLLIKQPGNKKEIPATIYYHDIGDYLKREEKLTIVQGFGSVTNPEMPWTTITPDDHGDWLNQRNEGFDEFVLIGDKKDKSNLGTFFTPIYGRGISTSRDFWCYNSSKEKIESNIRSTIKFYNQQRTEFHRAILVAPNLIAKNWINYDDTQFSWSANPISDLEKNREFRFHPESIVTGTYRPFFKQWFYYHRDLNERVYLMPKIFSLPYMDNRAIVISGLGAGKGFSTLISNSVSNLHFLDTSQCFPLYYYEKREKSAPTIFDEAGESEYIRRDGITDFILQKARRIYGERVSKEDIFYYVYGFLHHPGYRETFANDLKKTLPRLPLVDVPRDFWAFSKAGRALADLHLNYESVAPAEGVTVEGEHLEMYRVEKMRFGKKEAIIDGKTKRVDDLSTIKYNSLVTISNIPARAYEYIVNGKSAIHWIMERYQIKTDKKSGIRNDPNDWAKEVGNDRYILDLLLSIIRVSVETVEIVEGLPEVEF